MNSLSEISPDIFRLAIPFEDIFTTVFIIKTDCGAVLFDAATYPEDAEQYILPALNELNVSGDSLKYIVISHNHRDHAGSLKRLMQEFPCARVVSRSEALREHFSAYSFLYPENGTPLLKPLTIHPIPGHTRDCISLLDARTRTLLTGDCLQLAGIYGSGKWGANISLISEHIEAIDRLRSLNLDTIAAAHDYHPCGHIARGKAEISRYMDECIIALHRVRDTLLACPGLDDQAVADFYNQTTGLPTIGAHVVKAIRAALSEGVF